MTDGGLAARVTGTWSLAAWEQRYLDGRVVLPMGPEPAGVISYGGGRMQCLITRPGRPPFVTGGQWTASAEERARAYDECLAYAGRYTVDGDVVSHHVDLSLFPNWVGTVQRRTAVIDGTRLELVARLDAGTPEERTAHLVWQRMPDGASLLPQE